MAKANVAPIANCRHGDRLSASAWRDDAKRSDSLNASRRYQAGDSAGADWPAEPLLEGVVLSAQSVALPG